MQLSMRCHSLGLPRTRVIILSQREQRYIVGLVRESGPVDPVQMRAGRDRGRQRKRGNERVKDQARLCYQQDIQASVRTSTKRCKGALGRTIVPVDMTLSCRCKFGAACRQGRLSTNPGLRHAGLCSMGTEGCIRPQLRGGKSAGVADTKEAHQGPEISESRPRIKQMLLPSAPWPSTQ
jgi:hypothetical protein